MCGLEGSLAYAVEKADGSILARCFARVERMLVACTNGEAAFSGYDGLGKRA